MTNSHNNIINPFLESSTLLIMTFPVRIFFGEEHVQSTTYVPEEKEYLWQTVWNTNFTWKGSSQFPEISQLFWHGICSALEYGQEIARIIIINISKPSLIFYIIVWETHPVRFSNVKSKSVLSPLWSPGSLFMRPISLSDRFGGKKYCSGSVGKDHVSRYVLRPCLPHFRVYVKVWPPSCCHFSRNFCSVGEMGFIMSARLLRALTFTRLFSKSISCSCSFNASVTLQHKRWHSVKRTKSHEGPTRDTCNIHADHALPVKQSAWPRLLFAFSSLSFFTLSFFTLALSFFTLSFFTSAFRAFTMIRYGWLRRVASILSQLMILPATHATRPCHPDGASYVCTRSA